jgi:hypothetical protein
MIKIKMVALLSVLILLELTGAMIHKNNINTLESVNITSVIIQEPQEELVISEVVEVEDQKEFNYYGLTEDELNLVYAVVMQEGGPTYESAEYVMSTIVNRVNNPEKWSWAGETIIDQITYPQQYCYSLDDYWKQYLDGNVPDTVKNAVKSVIEFGPVHDYDCFRGYYLEDCEQVADNWYFIG